jgi:hypothetical protein
VKYSNYLWWGYKLAYGFDIFHLPINIFNISIAIYSPVITDRAMIKIPFDRCVILTTLDFAQITDRLESVIYNPHSSSVLADGSRSNQQRFVGEVRGFKFLATRILGHKYLHLPRFLAPAIEGKIDSLHHGYEISLSIKLHNITCVLLLTWLGGLFAAGSSVLDNMLIGIKSYQYLTILQVVVFFYLVVLIYLYFEAWSATKFFRTLFVRSLAGTTGIINATRSTVNFDHYPQSGDLSTDQLRKNLPSFPDQIAKFDRLR